MWGGVEYLKRAWPFFMLDDDLRASDRIVRKLPIPDSTKHFVYAISEPESQAVIYVLSVQSLSQRSAADAECLIRAIKPDAVIVQLGGDLEVRDLVEGETGPINGKGKSGENDGCVDMLQTVPTSVFEVLRRCFVHKIGRERYYEVAGSLVLEEVFGVSFNGHFVAAKKAAEEVGSSFLILESSFVKCNMNGDDSGEEEASNLGSGFTSAFGPHLILGGSVLSMNPRGFYVMDEVQSKMVQSLSSCLVHLNPDSKFPEQDAEPSADYEPPQFARCVYPLLVDLHDIFIDNIPSMGTALACAQKMLSDVNRGETVDARLLSSVYAFQIVIVGLRIALNNAGRLIKKPVSADCKFSDLPVEDKSHAILAQALRSQTCKYRSIVAVVDAGRLAGLRRHWNTTVPPEIKDLVEQLITTNDEDDDDELRTNHNRERYLSDKPMVAVGAGATAIVGVSSVSKVIPTSTFIKVAAFRAPASLKLVLSQTQKAILFAIGKTLGPTKLVAPGMASSTFKGSAVKAAASAAKIHTVVHSVIASAEKTSFSAMRTALYQIMRRRRAKPVGPLPWATFGCSVATCAGLLAYGDSIECAFESFPAAASIAELGRGIQSLHEVAAAVREAESSRIQNSIDSLFLKFQNFKNQ